MFVLAKIVIFDGSEQPGSPRQPWNWESDAGRASSRTTVPAGKNALHVPDPLPRMIVQLIPAGCEVIVPLPLPPGTMLRLPVPVPVGGGVDDPLPLPLAASALGAATIRTMSSAVTAIHRAGRLCIAPCLAGSADGVN